MPDNVIQPPGGAGGPKPASPAPAPAPGPAPAGGSSFGKILLGVLAGGCLLVIICALVSCATFASCADRARKRAEAERARLAALPVSEVSWSEIAAAFGPKSKNTRLQKAEAWKKYQGKKVRWTGKMLTVDEIIGVLTMQVSMDPAARLRPLLVSDAFVHLREDQKGKALELHSGGEVTFTGVLAGQNLKLGRRPVMVLLKAGTVE